VLFCAKVLVLVSRPRNRGLGLGLEFFKKVLTTTLLLLKTSRLSWRKLKLQGHVTTVTNTLQRADVSDCRTAEKRWVFRFFLNMASDGAETTEVGRSFHTRAPAIPNTRSPTVRSLVWGTISWCVVADLRRCRESSSATQCRSLVNYSGAVWLQQRKTSTASRYMMRSGTRNQWRSRSNEETWSYLREPFTKRAAAWSKTGVDLSDMLGPPLVWIQMLIYLCLNTHRHNVIFLGI